MHNLDLILALAGGFTAALFLDRLGATAEQIDRERARAHRELFDKVPADAPLNV